MTEDVIPGMDDPERYGIQDPEAPGEPDYWGHPPSTPVPGTAKQTRDERLGRRSGHHDSSEGTGHEGSSGGRGGHGGHH
ncbi:MAG TPA: hypothetical protein VFB58_01315 [Chloroflexota bacterium]|nr:hypothetical protein [Chloroflexota bacterium]